MTTLSVPDPFRYFGSREAVKKRFADLITASLDQISGREAALLSDELGLPKGTITDIVNGRLGGLNHQVVEALSDALSFGIEKGFTPFGEFPEAEQDAWRQLANEEQFFFIAGASDDRFSDLDQLKLFVVLQAFRQL